MSLRSSSEVALPHSLVEDPALLQKAQRYGKRLTDKLRRSKKLEDDRKFEEAIHLTDKWKREVLPRWSLLHDTKLVKKLCQKGVPSSCRGDVWQRLIGNALNVTEDTFASLVAYSQATMDDSTRLSYSLRRSDSFGASKTIESTAGILNDVYNGHSASQFNSPSSNESILENTISDASSIGGDSSCETPMTSMKISAEVEGVTVASDKPPVTPERDASRERHTIMCTALAGNTPFAGECMAMRTASGVGRKYLDLIQHDLPRTFPTLGFFHDTDGDMHNGLRRVLQAFSCFRPDVGYVQGMSYIVAMLLLYMNELEAFVCLANLISRRGNLDFYRLKKDAIDNYVACFDYYFQLKLPLLFEHLRYCEVTSEMFLMDWNLSLFSKALPIEVAARLWDCYLLEGEVFIIRAALGILKTYAARLAKRSLEGIMELLLHAPQDVCGDELMKNIEDIKITNYEQVRAKYSTSRGPALQQQQSPLASVVKRLRSIFQFG